jgi:hypothetical protein
MARAAGIHDLQLVRQAVCGACNSRFSGPAQWGCQWLTVWCKRGLVRRPVHGSSGLNTCCRRPQSAAHATGVLQRSVAYSLWHGRSAAQPSAQARSLGTYCRGPLSRCGRQSAAQCGSDSHFQHARSALRMRASDFRPRYAQPKACGVIRRRYAEQRDQ